MTRRIDTLLVLAALLLAGGCATTAPRPCASGGVRIDSDFEGAAFHRCVVDAAGVMVLTISPEDPPPINVSPWFAFRLTGPGTNLTRLRLVFEDGYARYWPKISTDRGHWRPMEVDEVVRSDDGTSMDLSVNVGSEPVWIAAQELITSADYDQWVAELRSHDEVTVTIAGYSALGRPIHLARTDSGANTVLLFGRQHPPEVSGAIAMRHFVAAIFADTPVARRFRSTFSLFIVPLLNPDGVALGHWRHNVNGVDLNRDWGPFTQPETQSIARLLEELEENHVNVRLMLDFHSTGSNLFYTQIPEEGARPVNFAADWLTRSRQRLPGYDFRHDARPRSGQANSKNYFFERYGIAAITYEIGDETERRLIQSTAPVFAEEMMKLLLEHYSE